MTVVGSEQLVFRYGWTTVGHSFKRADLFFKLDHKPSGVLN